MKIGFIFTDQPNLADVPTGGIYRANFEIPDVVKSLPDIQNQVIEIGQLVGQFTTVSLHLTCPDIGLKNYVIKQVDEEAIEGKRLRYNFNAMCLYFENVGARHGRKRPLKIYAPATASMELPRYGRGDLYFRHPGQWQDTTYGKNLRTLVDRTLALLNLNAGDRWRCEYFHPWVWQNSLGSRFNKRSRKERAEHRKREREEEKGKQREAKLAEKRTANPQEPLTHGAGRTVGARPGIYKGIQMRSQLEIRFAAELDERNIKWIYEGEALGASSYLVDFYLPDLGVWVEVKGKFEARDRQVLPEVAKVLKAERQHRLLVYTSAGKCCVVNPSGFREVERKNFWAELLR